MRRMMFRVFALIVVPLALVATLVIQPTFVTALPSVVVDLLLASLSCGPSLLSGPSGGRRLSRDFRRESHNGVTERRNLALPNPPRSH